METQIKSIEERLEGAKQEVARATEILKEYEQIKKKKELLKSNFKYCMGKTDLEIRAENEPTRHGVTSWGGLGQGDSLPLAKEDPALNVLYSFMMDQGNKFYSNSTWEVNDRIKEKMRQYVKKIWGRTITEPEYNSIVNATEPFIGRYVQRVYDLRKQEAEEFQKKIETEERAYVREHGKSTQIPVQEQPKVQPQQVKTKTSLLGRIFGGRK